MTSLGRRVNACEASPVQAAERKRSVYATTKVLRAKDVMRRSVITVEPTTSLLEAVRLLLQTNQRGLPVLDRDGKMVGIISEGDLIRRDELDVKPRSGNWLEEILGIEEASPARDRMHALSVVAIMTKEPIFVEEDAALDAVVSAMDQRGVGQVPVICNGKVVGMVGRFELITALERRLSESQRCIECVE